MIQANRTIEQINGAFCLTAIFPSPSSSSSPLPRTSIPRTRTVPCHVFSLTQLLSSLFESSTSFPIVPNRVYFQGTQTSIYKVFDHGEITPQARAAAELVSRATKRAPMDLIGILIELTRLYEPLIQRIYAKTGPNPSENHKVHLFGTYSPLFPPISWTYLSLASSFLRTLGSAQAVHMDHDKWMFNVIINLVRIFPPSEVDSHPSSYFGF